MHLRMISYILFFASICGSVKTARILVIPMGPKSHYIYVNAAAEELVVRGHDVYTIQPSYRKEPTELLKLGFKVLKYPVPEGTVTFDSKEARQEQSDVALGLQSMSSWKFVPLAYMNECEYRTEADFIETLRALHFDIALVDGPPIVPCMFLIPKLLDIPYISVSLYISWFHSRSPVLPSFVPFPFVPYTGHMNFFERLINLAGTILTNYVAFSLFGVSANMSMLLEKHIKDPNITWHDMISESSLFLVTRGPLLEWPAPAMPNTFYLEGLTARPSEPLSEEVKGLVDSATSGIVVVSFGSIVERLPHNYVNIFIKAFSQRPELFFFRQVLGTGENIEIPENVKIMSWLPQNDLLGHSKTKLFITHCGNNGQYEALYHGVPMIGFPLGKDQQHNGNRMVAHGYGLTGDLLSVTSQELLDKIAQVITDKSYKKRTEKAAAILKSMPMSARETAAYWIEHVLEFGSDHLRSHALDMPLYQYLMLDILAFVVAAFIMFNILVYMIAKILLRFNLRIKLAGKLETA